MSADPMQQMGPITGELVPARAAEGKVGKARARAIERNMEYVQRLDRKVRARHTRIVAMAAGAAEVDTGGPCPEGWTEMQYRVAQDARQGPREAPMYLAMAAKIVDSYKKAEVMAERDPAPQLNCDIQVFVQNTYNYAVQDGESEK